MSFGVNEMRQHTDPRRGVDPFLPSRQYRGWGGHKRKVFLRGALLAGCCVLFGLSLTHAELPKIEIVGLFKERAAVKIDGRRRVLRAGQTSPEGVTLVSADSRGAVIESGGKRRTYSLGGQIGGRYSSPGRREATLWRNSSGMFSTVGSINGRTVDFLVDTGASVVAMSAGEARRLGIDYRFVGRKGSVQTASGIAIGYYFELDVVQVGGISQRNVPAVVIDGEMPERVLLGMSFLGQLEIVNTGRSLMLREKF
jgi:aspartyl protease family protein